MFRFCLVIGLVATFLAPVAYAQTDPASGQFIRENYTWEHHQIPMRDGKRLYTIVYSPKDTSQKYPLLMLRTPYGIGPYEKDKHRARLGPNKYFAQEKYIFVYQDVRGCYMSEGKFENMRPQLKKSGGPKDFDESTDTFDTIEYLIKTIPNNNGKAGLYGISYPGFYTSVGMINAHPALKAASPQAPIANWFFDDFYHNGAFFLSHAFPFFSSFGQARPEPTMKRPEPFKPQTSDGYRFFLDLGSLKNINPRYFKEQISFWDTITEHPAYDSFWKDRNILPHLKKVAPAVMTVGGLFDAEDLYGTFRTYQAIEKQNPGIFNVMVIGPWAHGAWSGPDATSLGNINFGSNTADFYQKNIELPFFNHFLHGKGEQKLPEAYVFETGANQWRKFDHWPPRSVKQQSYYLDAKGALTTEPPSHKEGHDTYISDPAKPVPTCDRIAYGMPRQYMTDDMRYASTRPDVVTYQTKVLDQDLTLAGPIEAEIYVSTSGTDSDWMVKVIDVFPDGVSSPKKGVDMFGYQMHVRSEVLRGRYRNSLEKPEPFVPNKVEKIKLTLQDVMHTFKKGHRVMVQIHSTWFPLVDRNPQKYVPNIFFANDEDFVVARQRVFRSVERPSQIRVGVISQGPE